MLLSSYTTSNLNDITDQVAPVGVMPKFLADSLGATFEKLLSMYASMEAMLGTSWKPKNYNCKQHPTLQYIHVDLPPASAVLAQQPARFAGHCALHESIWARYFHQTALVTSASQSCRKIPNIRGYCCQRKCCRDGRPQETVMLGQA